MAGAHQHSAAELRVDMGNLVTWLQGANPAQQRVVVEYAPAHFSGTPYGEHKASFFTLPASRGSATPEQRGRCAPHNASLEVPPANNWRRSVMREVAAEYHLSLLAAWNVSARSHDDHTQHFLNGVCYSVSAFFIASTPLAGWPGTFLFRPTRHSTQRPLSMTVTLAR